MMGLSTLAQDEAIYLKLVRVVNLAARPFNQRIGLEHGLRLNEWRVMAILARSPGCAASRVAEQTGMDKMSISRALAGLQETGRALRIDDPDDQRRSRHFLTDDGLTLYKLVWIRAREREAELFAGVDAEELARLSATLDKLVAAMSRADSGAAVSVAPEAFTASAPVPLSTG